MSCNTRLARFLIASGSGVLIAGTLVSQPAASAPAPSASITILLKAPDQAGLDRLATAQGLDHAQRVAALATLLPSAATHQDVATTLRSDGFTVTAQTAWTVTAQAPSPTVTADFGAGAAVPSNASEAVRAAAKPVATEVPAAIAPLTAAVLPTNGGPPLFSPLNHCRVRCHSGSDFRNAYTAPKVTPSTGMDPHGPLTIATLQFAGWNPADLSDYAASVHLPDPVGSSGQYTQVPVDEPGGKVPEASKREHEADEEVDLDQETILSTDPTADQRAYFNTANTASGYAEDVGQVVSDVTQGPDAYAGGDPKIVALSTSWGACESDFGFSFNQETIKAVENMMKSLTAAGVTVFAASGDSGVYDCNNSTQSTKIAVDYPASSPEVVSVGGSRLSAGGNRSPNTGSNWTDKAWSCMSAETCQGFKPKDTGGTGGGESHVFRMPAYQSVGIGHQKFTTSTGKKGDFGTQTHRLVPDIADDGDPATGFEVLTSDPTNVKSCAPHHAPGCVPKSFAIGGTSLSSPEAAALFTDMLGSHGATAGVGDIHAALYSAYAEHHGAFRDITKGTNGDQRDVDKHAAKGTSAELPVTAQRGYDTLTGLGAPLWPRIAPFLFAPTAPTGSGAIALASPHSPTLARSVTARWSARQAPRSGSAPSSASVTITKLGSGARVFHDRSAPATGSHRFTAKPGGNYLLSVTAHDLAGQTSAPTTRLLVVPHDDRSFTFHGSWTRIKGGRDFAGSHATTDQPSAYATASERGRRYVLYVRTGPMYGDLGIYHGATRIGRYDLYSPTLKHLRIVVFGTAKTALERRTFTFRYTGRKNPQSTSRTINLDALAVRR
jgi:hypothetical protein